MHLHSNKKERWIIYISSLTTTRKRPEGFRLSVFFFKVIFLHPLLERIFLSPY